MLLKTIPLEARIENQPYGIAGILYHGTEIYESWTTLLLNPTLLKDESLWSLCHMTIPSLYRHLAASEKIGINLVLTEN